MDLNLYLGFPRSPSRLRGGVDLGSNLALFSSSPATPSPSSSTGQSRAVPAAAMPGVSEPYSPSRASIVVAADSLMYPDRLPPLAGNGGDDPVQEYSPLSPSYQSLGSRAISPALPPPAVSSRAPDAPYAMAYVSRFPADHNSDEGFVGDGDRTRHLLPYGQLSAAGLTDEPLVGGGGGGSSHVRYSPSYVSLFAIPEDNEDANFTPYRPPVFGTAEIFEGDDEPPLNPDFLDPEFRLRRLIELQNQPRERRRFRLSYPYRDEQPDSALEHEVIGPGGSAGNSRKNIVGDEGISDEGLKEKEEKKASAVNFECNICLDLAQEPVVTSCGHLFCWPCLYQWLHLHCSHSECPVCKGEVVESNITPIYGRGISETRLQEGRDGDSGLKIPPRPRGHRIESWRQRIRRPISRRFSIGIANTWRRVLGEGTHIGNRIDSDVEASLQEMINISHRRVATRLRARRSTRVEDNLENGSFSIDHSLSSRNAPSNQQNGGNTSLISQDGLNHWSRFSFGGFDGGNSLAALSANLSRIFGMPADNGGHSGAPSSSGNHQVPGDPIRRPSTGSSQAMDQASASSTMAVIQGDVGIVDVAAEPNSAGSSRPLRRRGRSSSSLDADGSALHARKRRRLN